VYRHYYNWTGKKELAQWIESVGRVDEGPAVTQWKLDQWTRGQLKTNAADTGTGTPTQQFSTVESSQAEKRSFPAHIPAAFDPLVYSSLAIVK
jgi:hypothetical protein